MSLFPFAAVESKTRPIFIFLHEKMLDEEVRPVYLQLIQVNGLPLGIGSIPAEDGEGATSRSGAVPRVIHCRATGAGHRGRRFS
jgi:hypothetical protein